MKVIACVEIVNNYPHNKGQYLEQRLTYTLTGEMRKHDSVPFDRGSDIPEYGISVKSARATIVSGNLMKAEDKDGQIAEYFARVHSDKFAYVCENGTAYIMNAFEFKMFLINFVKMERESSKNGGKYKMRLPSESRAVISWLNSLAA